MSDRTGAAADHAPHEVAGHLAYHDKPPSPATATIVVFDRPRRLLRAFGGGLTCWGLAILSVFVPLGHFILVPGFLLAGPVVFLIRVAEDVGLREVRGTCPACGTTQRFKDGGRLQQHHPLRCASCGRTITLTLDTPARANLEPEAAPRVKVTFFGSDRGNS